MDNYTDLSPVLKCFIQCPILFAFYLFTCLVLGSSPIIPFKQNNIVTFLMKMSIKPNSINKAKGLFLAAAGISFLLSIALWFTGSKEQGLYVGIWVPSICSAGSLILAGGRNG